MIILLLLVVILQQRKINHSIVTLNDLDTKKYLKTIDIKTIQELDTLDL